jgi:enoyl-CoA hydratase/carnithine racemase
MPRRAGSTALSMQLTRAADAGGWAVSSASIEHVTSRVAAGVMQLQLVRPEKKNALTQAMYRTLTEWLHGADADPAVRVVTLSGSGDSFSSGNDLADFLPKDDAAPDSSAALEFLATLAGMRKPVLAGVNGLAVGVGVTMLLLCDLVYAADTASFQLPFINLGVVPEAASTLLLPVRVGYHRAAELLLFGAAIDAEQAAVLGLVNATMPLAQLPGHLAGRAAALAGKPAEALLATKALLRRAPESITDRMQAEGAEFLRLLASEDTKSIITKFFSRHRG